MKIKICGLKDINNIEKIVELKPDYIGFIFYKKSKRYVADLFFNPEMKILTKSITRTGVFVDDTYENIIQIKERFEFEVIQLHGNESPQMCEKLKLNNLQVIKAFGVEEGFNFEDLKAFENVCDYFLFDTKSNLYGGSGRIFNWKLLEKYELETPFFLSGGLGTETLPDILKFKHDKLFGFDFNSKIELSPGIKSIQKTKTVINTIRKYATT